MTAKQLEQETGCKVMVRGRGSMRDKKKVCLLIYLLVLFILDDDDLLLSHCHLSSTSLWCKRVV